MKLRVKTDTIDYLMPVPLSTPPSTGPIREVPDALLERWRKAHRDMTGIQAELQIIKESE